MAKAKKKKRPVKKDGRKGSPGGMPRELEFLVNFLPDIVYFKDPDGRYESVNPSFCRVVGRPRAKVLGLSDADLFPKEIARICSRAEGKARRGRRSIRVEFSLEGRGEAVHLDSVKVPIFTGRNTFRGILGICRDVSEFKRQSEIVRELERRLSHVVKEAPLVLYAINKNGIFTLSEGSGLSSLGLKPGEVVGRSAFEMYAHNPRIVEGLKEALAGRPWSDTVTEGGIVFETRYSPQLDAGGGVIGTIAVATDVTARVRAEAELERHLEHEKALREEAEKANRAKDEFLALLSHELRTPMTAMMGWTWLLRSKEMSSKEAADALDTIERNMNAQAQIIEDLLDISKIVTGKMRLEPRVAEVAPILRAAVDILRPAAQAKDIELTIPPKLPELRVLGDPERLQQIFWNLVSNAVKFTPEHGVVDVDLRVSGKDAVVIVKDTGAGIDREYVKTMFDPFTQAERALTRDHGGLGLGLAIVHQIVELHGGSVSARSEGLGKGSEFRVKLPVTRARAAAAGLSPSKGPRRPKVEQSLEDLSGIHALIVDDETDTRTMLEATLKHCGARVTSAGTAAEAFEEFLKETPDVMIFDLAMPGEDGYSLLARIRGLDKKYGADVPAAALTALTRTEDRTKALRSGFQMYLPKPIEPAELTAVVASLAKKNQK